MSIHMISPIQISPQNWTLQRVWDARLAATPDKPFLSFQGSEFETYSDTYAKAAALGRALHQLGVRKGDRVVIFSSNSLAAIHAWMAINLIGAIDVPINPALRGQPLGHAINLTRPKLILAEEATLSALVECESRLNATDLLILPGQTQQQSCPGFTRLRLCSLPSSTSHDVDQLPDVAYNDIASIMLTSGTSGPSKGVMISHAQAFVAARQVVDGLRLTADDIHYCCQPLFHMSPRYFAIYGGLIAGTQVWIDRSFQAERWIDQVRASRATVTIGHGPLLEMIFDQPPRGDDIDNHLTRIAAAPFPKHIGDAFEKRFGVKGIEAWGMTEIGMPCWQPYDEPRRPGSCGRVRADLFDLAVVDPDTDEPVPAGMVGEFIIRPKHPWTISPGYFDDPDSTMRAWRNLWFHTGDGGYIDSEGWVYFVDRLKDRIRRRAENISSYDIELATLSFPHVRECAAIGVPSGYSGDDDIKIFVVSESNQTLDPLLLLRHIGKQVPHFMVPRFIEFVGNLPRTPTQKIRRAELRKDSESKSTWDRKSLGVSLRQLLTADVHQVDAGSPTD